jgi:hypothetical protein
LQASSSIISIAQSSRDVLSALDDIKTSIPAELPRSARRTSATEKDGKRRHSSISRPFVDDTRELDTQLRILQSVAAHIKLLLDTPEHIWRLLEKKKYLHAGWLFLLARIIYQALVRTDTEDEEDDWRAQGIDVSVCSDRLWLIGASAHGVSQEQFPLVQRQWDTVSQFRAQITYKATLSLRDSGASLEVRSSHMLVLDFWPTCAPGCLLHSLDAPSPRISAADRRIDNISHATSKDLAVNLIAKPKICTQWIFAEW